MATNYFSEWFAQKMNFKLFAAGAVWLSLFISAENLRSEDNTSSCEKAIELLENAGCELLDKEGNNVSTPCRSNNQLTVILRGDQEGITLLPHLAVISPKRATLALPSLDISQIEKLLEVKAVLEQLHAIHISCDPAKRATDADICRLASISNLTILNVFDSKRLKITDKSVSCLKDKQFIEALSLDNTSITDEGVRSLSGLTNLVSLSFLVSDVTGVGFGGLKGVPIESLALAGSPIDDAGLNSIAKLTKLRKLFLADCRIEGQGLTHLKELKNLRVLSLSNNPIDDAGLAHLPQLAKLEVLFLVGCNITDRSVNMLVKFPALKKLAVSDTKMTQQGIDRLKSEMPNTNVEY